MARGHASETTMVKTRTPKQRLTELANAIPSDTAIHATMIALESTQDAFADYAIAVVGAGLVEKALEVVILTRFVALKPDERESIFDYIKQGPLCDLSSRTKISYALGRFGPKTRDDLEHVRTIRNSFAHSLNLLRFETKEVADICALLHTPTTIKFIDRFLFPLGDTDTPRRRYIETTATLAGRLKGTIASAKRVRLTKRGAEIISNDGLP